MSWIALGILIIPLIYVAWEAIKHIKIKRAQSAELARIEKRLAEKDEAS